MKKFIKLENIIENNIKVVKIWFELFANLKKKLK